MMVPGDNLLLWQGSESRLIRGPRGGWIVEVLVHDALGGECWRQAEFITELPDEMLERIAGHADAGSE